MKKPTKELLTAIHHVKEFYPTVSIVVFNKEGRWNYMDEDFYSFVFDESIDVSILEAASDSITDLPYIFQL